MKLNRILTLCVVAASLAISASSLVAQDNGGGNDNGGQRRSRNGGGPGGWGDPAQRAQRMLDGVRDRLDFTNDTEWDAVKPLAQKVIELQSDLRSTQMRAIFSGRNRSGDQGGDRPRGGGFLGPQSPEAEALQKAIDDGAPSSQIKDLLAKYKASQQAKQAKLEAAQDALKAVLDTKQEAQAYMLGLVR
jgi:hypothetical protein